MKIGVIVEGHGDVKAVPILLRRMLELHGVTEIEIPQPFRLPRGRMKDARELARAVELMARRTAPDGALLILLDADDDCPAELGPQIASHAVQTRRDRPISVVVAKREFEAWLIGGAESLRGRRGLPSDLVAPDFPEDVRDAKGWLSSRMPRGYSESLDQPALAAVVDLSQIERVTSFAKLRRDLMRLAQPYLSAHPGL